MKARILFMATLVGSIGFNASCANVGLLDAIEQVESGGNSRAIGDSGKAVGAYQIWPIMVAEVNRISGQKFTLNDRYNRAKSRQMCEIYLDWSYKVNKSKGYTLTDAELSRCWNGGNWNSWQKKSTLSYKKKILKHLNH